MNEPTDHELLAEYARTRDNAPFTALAARYLNLVHTAAWRATEDDLKTEEVTQAVFIILAGKAGRISPKIPLGGWLYETARLTAANLAKADLRRLRRQYEALMQSNDTQADAAVWRQIAPALDDAMGRLGATDRTLVVLRYFEKQTTAEVAAALRMSEAAVQKRGLRCLEKLRKILEKQGVHHSADIIAEAVSQNAVMVAPVGLAAKISVISAKGLATTTTITTLVNATMKTMTWMKFKFPLAISAVVLVTGGLVTVALSGQKPQQVPIDAVAFFKQAISSPLHVDSFIAGQRSLRSLEDLAQLAQLIAKLDDPGNKKTSDSQESLQKAKKMQLENFYAGARAGSDYFLRYISSPTTPQIPAENASIIGRAGTVFYQVGKNNVSYGSGTNAFVSSVNSSFNLVRQFLDMGLADVEPESVVWTGNQFTALNQFGKSRYGDLEISNNLPVAINVSSGKNSPIYMRIEYQYPNPPASLAGFPAKIK